MCVTEAHNLVRRPTAAYVFKWYDIMLTSHCEKPLGIKWYHHVRNDDVRLKLSNHTFRLLFKHGVSPCSATLPECQTNQMLSTSKQI